MKRFALKEEIERRYGDGHYDERKGLLSTVVGRFSGLTLDLDKVVGALRSAKHEQLREAGTHRDIREVRRLAAERNSIRERLISSARATLAFYQKLINAPPPVMFTIFDELQAARDLRLIPLTRILQDVLETIPGDPVMSLPLEGPGLPHRLPKEGRPPTPWLREARSELAEAGVPAAVREDLLIAVGLRPYTSR